MGATSLDMLTYFYSGHGEVQLALRDDRGEPLISDVAASGYAPRRASVPHPSHPTFTKPLRVLGTGCKSKFCV